MEQNFAAQLVEFHLLNFVMTVRPKFLAPLQKKICFKSIYKVLLIRATLFAQLSLFLF